MKNLNKIKYYLGIDGGGTKTEFLLEDLNGNKIGECKIGASNPVDIGVQKCKEVLEEGIRKICKGLNYKEISVFIGIAGGTDGNNKEKICKFLSDLGFLKYNVGNDIENAIALSIKENDGIVIICGTRKHCICTKK